ncbi:hypothetical protein AB0C77_07790 [Streptomyces sp. NPDC048629]|uniref:hypothetical protein n=1 Tax=Streptomyces sp. NPDC048629 TaxID=3154824 RepID=UPI00342F052A
MDAPHPALDGHIGLRRRGTDVAADWYAVYGIQHSNLAAQPGLQRLTVVAALVLGTAPFIRRHPTKVR